jgi:hypothetical protein
MMLASMEKPAIFENGMQMQNIAVNTRLRDATTASRARIVRVTRQAWGSERRDLV